MFDSFIDQTLAFLLRVFVRPEIATALIAALPIVEARLAIPIGLRLGLGWFGSWGLAYLGSSVLAPLLLLVLIPFIRMLARTRVFRRIGSAIYDKFEKKSRSIASGEAAAEGKKRRLSAENKKMLGVFLFVAVPLPLTGVWTGCAIASILGLRYWKSLVAVLAGNLSASLIILLLCRFFEPYMNTIILVIGLIALVVVIALVVRIIMHKPEKSAESAKNENGDGGGGDRIE